jgi:hypothetical protein
MTFFTRPKFQDRQIVQHSGSSITLSGDTNIDQIGYFRIHKNAFPGLVATSLDNDGTVGWGPISGISWSISACTSPLYVNNLVSCPSSGGTIQVDSGSLDLNSELRFLISLSAGTNTDDVLVLDNNGFVRTLPYVSNSGNMWYVPYGYTLTVPNNHQSFVYGDVYVLGTVDLQSNAQLVILNGNLILSGGSIVGSGSTYLVTLNNGCCFTGGTGSCITDLYVTNIHGCSPITIWDPVQSYGSEASGLNSFVFSNQSTVKDDYSAILGGNRNIISGNSINSGIIAGSQNKIFSGDSSVIIGGYNNLIDGHAYSTILGGVNNIIHGPTPPNLHETIIGGNNNIISGTGVSYSSILGGYNNKILGGSFKTIILNSYDITAEDSANSIISCQGGGSIVRSDHTFSLNSDVILQDSDNNILFNSNGISNNTMTVALNSTGISADTSSGLFNVFSNDTITTNSNNLATIFTNNTDVSDSVYYSLIFLGSNNKIIGNNLASFTSNGSNVIINSDYSTIYAYGDNVTPPGSDTNYNFILSSINSTVNEYVTHVSIIGSSGITINPNVTKTTVLNLNDKLIDESNTVYTPNLLAGANTLVSGNRSNFAVNEYNSYGNIRPNYGLNLDSGTLVFSTGVYDINIPEGWVIEDIKIYVKTIDTTIRLASVTTAGGIFDPETKINTNSVNYNILSMIDIYDGAISRTKMTNYFVTGDTLYVNFYDSFGVATSITDGEYVVLIKWWYGPEIL